jgi:hypothetical protein
VDQPSFDSHGPARMAKRQRIKALTCDCIQALVTNRDRAMIMLPIDAELYSALHQPCGGNR